MDRYDERIIKGKTGAGAIAVLVLSVLIAILGLVLMLLFPPIGFFILAIGIVAGVFAKDNTSIEYEYIITNGDIEIAKIMSKKRRKLMKEIEASNVTRVEYASAESVKNDLSLNKIKVNKYLAKEEDGKIVAVYTGEGNNKTITLLDLNDKCIDHFKTVYKVKCFL